MEKSRESGSPRFLFWSLISVIVAAMGYIIEYNLLICPPMPPLQPGQESVLDPAWKITIHHCISLRLNPPPPLTGAD